MILFVFEIRFMNSYQHHLIRVLKIRSLGDIALSPGQGLLWLSMARLSGLQCPPEKALKSDANDDSL